MNKLGSLFKSRRFWVFVAGSLNVATSTFGLPVPPGATEWITGLAASWIVGDSVRKTE